MRRTLRICPTPGCPEYTTGGPCTDCRAEADQRRGTARQRGYDREHERTRARLLHLAYGQPCPRCQHPMLPGQDLDAGHSQDRATNPEAKADRIEHASCNRSAGGQLGRRIQTGRDLD